MRTVQLREAKATLSALVNGAAKGDTAVITCHGKPGPSWSASTNGTGFASSRRSAACWPSRGSKKAACRSVTQGDYIPKSHRP